MRLRLLTCAAVLATIPFGTACGEGNIGAIDERGNPRDSFVAGPEGVGLGDPSDGGMPLSGDLGDAPAPSNPVTPTSPGDPVEPPFEGEQCEPVGLDPLPPCDDGSYYVSASGGNDSSPGTAAQPWATLGYARRNAGPGATICVNSGNYGSFTESSPPSIGQAQVMRAAPGQTPTVSNISINYGSRADAMLTLSGFKVYKSSGGAGYLVYVNNANNLRLSHLDASSYKWAIAGAGVECARVWASDGVIFDHNWCHNVHVGMVFQDTDSIRVLYNNFENTAGSGVRNVFYNTNVEISYNHIHGADWSPNGDSPDSPHASIISNRSGSTTIRGNHMHGMGNSSGVMFYSSGEPQYNDILFENNVIYDTINVYAMRIYNLGNNVVIRNNVFYSGLKPGGCADGSDENRLYRMKNGFIVHNKVAGPGLKFNNNIVVGALMLSDANIAEERNNYVWSWINGSTWRSTSLSGASTIVHSSRGDDCSSSTIFEDGRFFSDAIDAAFPGRGAYPLDLAPGSPGENFGEPTKQPAESLGTLDANGFVRPGPCRGPDASSVGAYEIVE